MKYILSSFLILLFACACDSKTKIDSQSVELSTVPAAQEEDSVKENKAIIEQLPSHINIFDSRVEWPKFDISKDTKPIYIIKSGTDKTGAWFEGKGYFHFDLEKLIADMSDPMKMGPSNVTQDLTRNEYIQKPESVDYKMHVALDYIMTVAFDLSVHIDVFRDNQGKISDIVYDSHKVSGTSLIKRIDEYYIVHALDNGWFQIEFQSLTDAMVTKEDETRAHFELLFAEWENN
ncbi:MAG: hypothetical protein J6A01_09770 [Proteobacteria bacterium]|nr:hypothetical protein [Pseudomonadota bacterium]